VARRLESTEHAHVISRRQVCLAFGCSSVAAWDVDAGNGWVPYCWRHANAVLQGRPLPRAPRLPVVGRLGAINLVSDNVVSTGREGRDDGE